MTQFKVFRNKDIDKMERDVNYWMRTQGETIKVTHINTETSKEMSIVTIVYVIIPNILHN